MFNYFLVYRLTEQHFRLTVTSFNMYSETHNYVHTDELSKSNKPNVHSVRLFIFYVSGNFAIDDVCHKLISFRVYKGCNASVKTSVIHVGVSLLK